MDMQKYIVETLKDIGVPISFVARGESHLPLVVFNVTMEKGKVFWDDEEMITHYSIMINIFSKTNFIDLKQEITNRMLDAGFIRKEIPATIYMEDTEVFNQPMAFDYYYEKDEGETHTHG